MAEVTLRRTDELLTELTELVETARTVPMSTACMVPREHLLDLLDELREALPPEMDEARRLVDRRDTVLREAQQQAGQVHDAAREQAESTVEDARQRAGVVLAEAQAQAEQTVEAARERHARLVSAAEVHQAAAAAAAEIRDNAGRYAAKLAADAEDYAERTLAELAQVLHHAAGTADQGRLTLAQRRGGPDTADGALLAAARGEAISV